MRHKMTYRRLVYFVTGIVCTVLANLSALSADLPSKYERRTPGSDTVIVFVHGVMGDSQSTWTNGKAYWPSMLASDETFKDADIFVLSYPTSMWATLSPDEIAENMRVQLDAKGVTEHRHIIFLAHSLGGVVTRAYLLKNRDVAGRTLFAYFFSTPTEGSQMAQIATFVSGSPQFSNLKSIDADNYLGNLLRHWLDVQYEIPSYCAYEKQPTYRLFLIVAFQSAAALCTKPIVPIDANHIDIVKPLDENAMSYLAFKAAYTKEIHRPDDPALIAKRKHYDELASDLSGFKFEAENLVEFVESGWTTADSLKKLAEDYNYSITTIRRKEPVFQSWIKQHWGEKQTVAFKRCMDAVKSFDREAHSLNDEIAAVAIKKEREKFDDQIAKMAVERLKPALNALQGSLASLDQELAF